MTVCSRCGAETPNTAKFCMECGQPFPIGQVDGDSTDKPTGRVTSGGTIVQCPYCIETHTYPSQVHTAMNHRSLTGPERQPDDSPIQTRVMGGMFQDRMRRPGQPSARSEPRLVTRRFTCPRTQQEFIAKVILG